MLLSFCFFVVVLAQNCDNFCDKNKIGFYSILGFSRVRTDVNFGVCLNCMLRIVGFLLVKYLRECYNCSSEKR